MLGWTGRGLKAGEAGLELWCPLQAALTIRWVLTPQTWPGGWGGTVGTTDASPFPQGRESLRCSLLFTGHSNDQSVSSTQLTGTLCMPSMSVLETKS